jgi:hypothetical protein
MGLCNNGDGARGLRLVHTRRVRSYKSRANQGEEKRNPSIIFPRIEQSNSGDLPFGEPRPRTFLTPRVLTRYWTAPLLSRNAMNDPGSATCVCTLRSAARTYEGSFCAETLAQLSPDDQASLDALLQPAPDEGDSQREARPEMPRALWHTLRSEPVRTSLDTMLE